MIRTYSCPVCGFAGMEDPPADHSICSCCGTHFGYHDTTKSFLELRNMWLMRGGHWFYPGDRYYPRGVAWNAWQQLRRCGLPFDIVEPNMNPLGISVEDVKSKKEPISTPRGVKMEGAA